MQDEMVLDNASHGENSWRAEVDKLGAVWCRFMHNAPMWPIHGYYECGVCGRNYPVPWADHGAAHDTAHRI